MPGLPRAPARPPRAIYTIHLLAYSKSSATPRFFVTKRSCHRNTFAVPHRRPGLGHKRTKACNPRHATSSKSWARAAGTSPPMRAVLRIPVHDARLDAVCIWAQLTVPTPLCSQPAPRLWRAPQAHRRPCALSRASPCMTRIWAQFAASTPPCSQPAPRLWRAPQTHRRPCALPCSFPCMTRIWAQFTMPTPPCSQPAPRLWHAAGSPPPMRAVVRAHPHVHDAHLDAVYHAHAALQPTRAPSLARAAP